MKSIFKSKVFWVNMITLMIIVVQYLTDQVYISSQTSALILAILNIILRFYTDTKAVIKKKK